MPTVLKTMQHIRDFFLGCNAVGLRRKFVPFFG